MTNAERQAKHRAARKAAGMVEVKISVTQEEYEFLQECWRRAGSGPEHFGDFVAFGTLRGACFTANAGAGKDKLRLPAASLRRNG